VPLLNRRFTHVSAAKAYLGMDEPEQVREFRDYLNRQLAA